MSTNTTIEKVLTPSEGSSLIVTRDVILENPGTIAANSTGSYDFNCTYSGYSRIGMVAFTGSGTNGLVLQEFYNTPNEGIRVYVRNITSADKTPTSLRITALYRKT